MKSRNVVFTLVLVLLLLTLAVVRRWAEPQAREVFHRSARLQYTAFALCQLQCKGISRNEVSEVAQTGLIHYSKSNGRRWPCPTFVLQARTRAHRNLRIVFEQCRTNTVVLAADDLEQKDSCRCLDDR